MANFVFSSEDNGSYRNNITEYVGIDSSGTIPAKSLEFLVGPDRKIALVGVAKLWGALFNERANSIITTSSVELSPESDSGLAEILVAIWLKQFNKLLQQHLHPVFISTKERRSSVSGQVDYIDFETRMTHGEVPNDFDCRTINLTFSIPELKVIRDAYDILPNILSRVGLQIIPEVRRELMLGAELVRPIPTSSSPMSNALSLLRSRRVYKEKSYFIDLAQKLRNLNDVVSFCVDLVVNGLTNPKSKILGMPGVVFNLNYLLEMILREAMLSVGGSKSPQVFLGNRINNIEFHCLEKPGASLLGRRFMQPDCFGLLQNHQELKEYNCSDLMDHIYIMDAKHKFFAMQGSAARVSREDFYQLVAYASTHYGKSDHRSLYAFIGLDSEISVVRNLENVTGRYVDFGAGKVSVNRIEFGNSKGPLDIIQIPIKFGQFLYDIGRASQMLDVKKVIKYLGRDLLVSLKSNIHRA